MKTDKTSWRIVRESDDYGGGHSLRLVVFDDAGEVTKNLPRRGAR